VLIKEIPHLEVASVVPGGPADRAGVKVGDVVSEVDGHWVVNSSLINKFRVALKKFNAKKLPLSELNIMRSEIRSKSDHAIFPSKAKDKLFLGKAGVVNVVWDRGGKPITTKIDKAPSQLPGFSASGESIVLPLTEGDGERLKKAIEGKTHVTIDLRHSTLGDPQVMRQCLADLAPSGQYGSFATQRHDTPTPLSVQKGNSQPPKIKLLVDKSTRGMAEVLAMALASKGLTTVDDSEMGGDLSSKEIVQLPDGSGYSLVTSNYQTTAAKTAVASAKRGALK
jgi:C-terminal processing protease CtpA/Prc